jgi:hypothetical protein
VLGTIVDELPAIHYVIAQFGGPVRVARYETFGTEELAAAVCEALGGDRSAALMANHGAVVTGSSIEQAVDKAVNLEWLASVHYHAIIAGTPQILSEADLDAVRERARALRPRPAARVIRRPLPRCTPRAAVACVGLRVDVPGRPVSGCHAASRAESSTSPHHRPAPRVGRSST